MKLSSIGKTFVEEWERRRSKVYLDSGGAPTIGIGHLLTKSERQSGKIILITDTGSEVVKYSNGITDSQIDTLLVMDMSNSEKIINVKVKQPLSQNQYDSLAIFVFNIGVSAFAESTLLKVLNKGLMLEVIPQFRRWVMDNGVKVKGLVNRREAEILVWNNQWRIKYNA